MVNMKLYIIFLFCYLIKCKDFQEFPNIIVCKKDINKKNEFLKKVVNDTKAYQPNSEYLNIKFLDRNELNNDKKKHNFDINSKKINKNAQNQHNYDNNYFDTSHILETVRDVDLIQDDGNYAYTRSNNSMDLISKIADQEIQTPPTLEFNRNIIVKNGNVFNNSIIKRINCKDNECSQGNDPKKDPQGPLNEIHIPSTSSLYQIDIDKNPSDDPGDPDIKSNCKKSRKKEKGLVALGLLSYLGFFVPTISLSPYTSLSTFIIEILSRKYIIFKKILMIILPITLSIEMFESISYWIRNSISIAYAIFTDQALTFIFIAEILIHILPLIGLSEIKSGRKMRFYLIHIPLIFLTSLIYSIYSDGFVFSKFFSSYGFVLFIIFLIPLTSLYLYNLKYTEIWFRKILSFLFSEPAKVKKNTYGFFDNFKLDDSFLKNE